MKVGEIASGSALSLAKSRAAWAVFNQATNLVLQVAVEHP